MISERLLKTIRHIDNFPKPGVGFKDLTPVFRDPALCRELVNTFAADFKEGVNVVVGIESRGFFFGPSIALELNAAFVPVRKKGKLPYTVHSEAYALEYGHDILEMHTDAILPGETVLIHDDVLATGGTAEAVKKLVEKAGGIVVGFSFIIELAFLNGRNRLDGHKVRTLVTYN
ncbi:MAG: adenine phosphoribosyltransferase [Bacteroidota bacterium]